MKQRENKKGKKGEKKGKKEKKKPLENMFLSFFLDGWSDRADVG